MCSSDEMKNSIDRLTQKLEIHESRFDKHEKDEVYRHQIYIKSQQESIDAVRELSEKTHDMVEAWEAAEGVVKAGATLGKFVKWLSGFAMLGGILHWLGIHIPK